MNPFRAPSRVDGAWHKVGLASAFPDLDIDYDGRRITAKCKAFRIPNSNPNGSQEAGCPVEADIDLPGDLKDQVLVFKYKGKFHAIDHGSLFDIEDFGVVLSAGITCPKHGWSFDLFSGQSDRGNYKLKVWEVQLRDPPASTDRACEAADKEVWMALNANEEWFRYTRGRFLSNETHEMAIRYVKFNMDELVKHAAESVGLSSAQCVRVEKFPDGMFNKTFLFTMQDGTQVVGKVPNPNAGRAHYTTASDVATMDFVRNELRTLVPKVLAWSSKPADNFVGAEYIIMEKVAGVQLSKVWSKMGIKERFELVKTISGYQKAWTSMSFTQYGSLYYSSDTDSDGCDLAKGDGSVTKSQRFAVGPSTGREFLDDGGSAEQYKSAVGLQEIVCVQNMATLPPSFLSLYGPGTYRRSRSKKVAAL
ncbi:hypothetical protein KXX33_006653 [Aspergillus fumigatus]|nr:hypothetical protein CNMCM8812_002561 [Aspergillus fumigatus]KAF4288877.1 hypothetical protein CNMCM8686_003489 [Aspergillus fumigatus]KAH1268973.1 hypothetical protein KXX45_003615 [Aspergillus fumigatus]KAH1317451.1 hypothetical protein KXX66_005650 [Aspergillus fumigatus]KAH1357497.1 hypothetical protein KXX33_006653 [Aspergillus fumigatus]